MDRTNAAAKPGFAFGEWHRTGAGAIRGSLPTAKQSDEKRRAEWSIAEKVKNMKNHPVRKWVRLRDYDYSADGAYFVTICTFQKKHTLSRIVDHGPTEKPNIILTPVGKIVEEFIKTIPGIDKYVIMPNHIHLLIIKTNGKPLASDIRSFKGLSSKKAGTAIWQNSYYDHVIRDEEDYRIKWKYIDDNPAKWASDEYYSIAP